LTANVRTQPFVMSSKSDELQLVVLEALWAEAGGHGRIMCRARRLWRPAETFGGMTIQGAFKPGLLLPDTKVIEFNVTEVCDAPDRLVRLLY